MRDELRTHLQSPYRQWPGPRKAEPSREISLCFVMCFVVSLFALTKVLSREPSLSESFDSVGAWQPMGHLQPVAHRRQ
jgi:hypothetical protein